MKNFQDLKISADSTDSPYTTNPRNQRKVEKTFYYYQIKVCITFNRIETSSQCTKQQRVESDQYFT